MGPSSPIQLKSKGGTITAFRLSLQSYGLFPLNSMFPKEILLLYVLVLRSLNCQVLICILAIIGGRCIGSGKENLEFKQSFFVLNVV